MDLLNENRSLIHTGKLLRQPDTGFEWNSWTELFVLLFDNYCKNLVSHHLTLSANTSCSGDDQAKREGWFRANSKEKSLFARVLGVEGVSLEQSICNDIC